MFVRVTSYLCLGVIAMAVFFYVIFGSSFAELSVQLPRLDFPIFIGELLLLFCVIVFIGHLVKEPVMLKGWHAGAMAYAGWVVLKAVDGYISGGSYGLRNAALFYYPLFALLTHHFIMKIKLAKHTLVLLGIPLAMAAVALSEPGMTYPLFMTALCLAGCIPRRRIKYSFFIIIISLFVYRLILLSSGRACLVGVVTGVLFLGWYMMRIQKVLLEKQVVPILAVIILVGGSLWYLGDRNAIISLIKPQQMFAAYNAYDKIVDQQQAAFVPCKISSKLYHKNEVVVRDIDKGRLNSNDPEIISKKDVIAVSAVPVVASFDRHENNAINMVDVKKKAVVVESADQTRTQRSAPAPFVASGASLQDRSRSRNLESAYYNVAFRFFIWRDMLRELVRERAFLGFSFGRPQRSASLEILHWGEGEWSRDGWIAPHNAFLHMIYRGGIVGLGVIVFILVALGGMMKNFLQVQSWKGGLLLSALVYWIVIAQFGVILELPYNAIAFWALFGGTWAYRDKLIAESLQGA